MATDLMTKLFRLVLVVVLMMACLPVSSGAVTPLKIGIAPNGEDSVALAELWIPFLDQVEQISGVSLRFSTAPDLLEFNQRLGKGDYDLVVTDQYLFTIFSRKHGLAYIAELAKEAENTQMALVTAAPIDRIEQLKGSLLAVKEDEKTSTVQALDEFLSAKGVTTVRDSLASYNKILESISEELHQAGLVPLNEAMQADQNLNILWQADSKHSYVMTSLPGVDPDTMKKLITALRAMQLSDDKHNVNGQVSILSVTGDSQDSEARPTLE